MSLNFSARASHSARTTGPGDASLPECAAVVTFIGLEEGGHDTGLPITRGSTYKNHITFNPATFCEIPMSKSKIRVLSNLAKDLSGDYDESLAQYPLGLDTTYVWVTLTTGVSRTSSRMILNLLKVKSSTLPFTCSLVSLKTSERTGPPPGFGTQVQLHGDFDGIF